jgi:nucleoid DNA-binding protein
MKIEHYLSQLLYRHQCVTVPGFGAFLAEIQSARLQPDTYTFYPPKKLISFNSHLKNNDGLLANHIAQSEKITYENAVSIIENEVVIWKNRLFGNEKITLKNIGDFSLNAEKSIVFVPSENINYLTDAFGLSTFISPAIKREIYKETETEETETPVLFLEEERKSRPYLKYAAILLLALSVSGTIGYKMYENRIAEETLLVETAVQKKVQNKIQEATFFIDNPVPTVTLTVKEEKLSYHIVAGAFRSESNAQRKYEELIGLGYQAKRIEPNKHGLFPVLYGSYATQTEAQQAMREIHITFNPDAWLLVKEL